MNQVEIGPFTPQELEQVCNRLAEKNIPFQILKDEETEKLENKADFVNLVNKAEFRTETYLAQIYYLQISAQHAEAERALFAKYGMMITPHQESPVELDSREDLSVKKRAQETRSFRAFVAGGLLFLIVLYWIWYFKDVF